MRYAHALRRVGFALCLALLCGCAVETRGPVPYPVLEDSPPDLRARMTAHLGENLFSFWLLNSVDEEYGGFLTDLARDGTSRPGKKMLVTQARLLWAFSRMWRAGYHDPRIREGAEGGLRFLREHFWDDAHDGWFWQVERDGTPDDMNKKTYGQAFTVYALTEYSRAFDDPAALELAVRTFEALEAHAKDPSNPGYRDFMNRRWRPVRGPFGSTKTMNTHLHLMEAFTELYAETGDALHGQRLREMLDILSEKCYLPEYGCCIDGFNYDWTPSTNSWFGPRNRMTSYGHNVEFAWLMQRAVRVLGLPEARYREIGLTLVDHALRYGWAERAGALRFGGPWSGPATRRDFEWWVQAENAVALDWAYRETGEPRYLRALRRQVGWLLNRQSDGKFGGWYSNIGPDGEVSNPAKATAWHGAYHAVRACVNVGRGRLD